MDTVETLNIGVRVLVVGAIIELLLYTKALPWPLRRYSAGFCIALLGIASGLILFELVWPLVIFFILIQVYRLVNLARIVNHRERDTHLRPMALRTSIVLMMLCGLTFAGHSLYQEGYVIGLQALASIATLQLIAACVLLANALGTVINMRAPQLQSLLSDNELPTLTVAIPARNETYDMAACLESLLASDYTKLEILVLDDCSQDSTSEVLRDFAHRGVRFLHGTVPSNGWLPKNHALNQLFKEANGELVLFCGVDVRFEPASLRHMVSLHIAQNLAMMSLLPRRQATFGRHFLLQPLRYWHEIALPRLLSHTPPVLSTCWLVTRAQLQQAGGFEAYKQAINPERFFARYFDRHGYYRFYKTSAQLAISSLKGLAEQWSTAVRTRYPEAHRRLETVCMLTIAELIVLVGPPLIVFYSYTANIQVLWSVGLLAIGLLICTHVLILYASGSRAPFIALLNFPLVIVAELFVINYSLWRYEFSEVYWKGRNVCIPILRSIPHLPKS